MAKGLEILEHTGDGYQRNAEFESWVVATMTYSEKNDEKFCTYIERHLETDEVFVLVDGSATLVIGMEMEKVPMEKYKIYNVKKAVWHTIFTEKDAKVLIVENSNTAKENSEYHYYR